LIAEDNAKVLAECWLSKGLSLNKTGRRDEVEEAFQKSLEFCSQAISKNAGDIGLLAQKGKALFEPGRYNEAIAVYGLAINNSPDIELSTIKIRAWIGRGDALRALGKFDNATSFAPKNEMAREMKGILLALCRKKG